MTDKPVIHDAPGLTWRRRKIGWEARWQARTDLVGRGYLPKSARLWTGVEPTETERAWIIDRCKAMQAEMLVWGRGGVPQVMVYDGTMRSLIAAYKNDPDSPYQKIRFVSRKLYDSLTKTIERDHGDEAISGIKARHLLRWHEAWAEGGKIASAHALIGMTRTLAGFGATILEDDECERISGVLHRMRFKMAKPRNERLTADQAIAIRREAHRAGRPSMALAQAIQFEAMLRQKDVIGEWVPLSEPGISDVTAGNEKWLRGIRWEEIDDNLILRHVTSKRQKEVEVDLKLAPMVLEELQAMGGRKAKGPVVVSERDLRPYSGYDFRKLWRKLAKAAGVPASVRNMDTRAGAISEATDAGADLEHIRHAATHSDIGMTQRYSRAGAEKTATVMKTRTAFRATKTPSERDD